MLPPIENSGKFHISIVTLLLCNVKYSFIVSSGGRWKASGQITRWRYDLCPSSSLGDSTFSFAGIIRVKP
jgi:hypothetical protein